MPDISPSSVAGTSTAQGVPQERGESNAQPPARTSSRLPTSGELMEFMGIGVGSRRQRPEREEATHADAPPRSAMQPGPMLTRQNAVRTPEDAERRVMPQPLSRRLTRTLGQVWTRVANQPSTSGNRNDIGTSDASLASTSEARPTRNPAPPDKSFRQEMREWAGTCERNQSNWYAGWLSQIRNMRGFEKDLRPALQGTADILTASGRTGNPVLNLQFCPLPEFPADLSRLAHLTHISIHSGALQSLPDAIDTLRNLRSLKLFHNPLHHLPASLEKLTQLKTLEIIGSPSLTKLPENLVSRDATGHRQGLVNLQALTMRNTGLTELPGCVRLMDHLRTLELDRSPLTKLPDDIHRLRQLRTLSLQGTAITELPPLLGALPRLTRLDLRNCGQLSALPANIGSLGSLKHLDLGGCAQLETLPDSIRDLPPGCEIRVPPHLQRQLYRLRPRAMSPIEAAKVALEMKKEDIDTASRWMLDQVTFEARNPFVEGNPYFDPDDNSGRQRETLRDIPALKTLVLESMQPDLLRFLNDRKGLGGSQMGDPINAPNLVAAVMMWREREMAVAEHPTRRTQFPALDVYLPSDVPHPDASPPPSGTDASDRGASSSGTRPR